MSNQKVIIGNSLDVLRSMESESVDVCVTSPPYWALRDYGSDPVDWGDWKGQLGLEPSPMDYINHLMMIFDEVKRVLKPSGACWVNIGDTYSTNAGQKYNGNFINGKITFKSKASGKFDTETIREKSLCQIPSRFAIAMSDHGWILRNEIIWHKPNVMPVSVTDRFTVDFEKFYFFTKEPKYYFNQQFEDMILPNAKTSFGSTKTGNGNPTYSGNVYDAGKLNGKRNKRTVWTITTHPNPLDHCAMFPPALIETPIKACCPPGGTVLDPFCGSGTTLEYCFNHDINGIGIEVNPDFKEMIEKRAKINQMKLELC